MTAYGGRNSKRSNAPCGHYRHEVVLLTKDDEIVLSGSPIEYFVHEDYRNAANRVTSANYAYGIAGIYHHNDTAWIDPSTKVTSVSRDGYTITMDSSANCDKGDTVEVHYYSTVGGIQDSETGAQVGDPLAGETFDAMVQKLNDAPPLRMAKTSPSLSWTTILCQSSTIPSSSPAYTPVMDYSGTGTWGNSDLPFYVTQLYVGWDGQSLDCSSSAVTADWLQFKITFDSTDVAVYIVNDLQKTCLSANATGTGSDQFTFINFGMIECSDFKLEVLEPTNWGAITAFTSRLGGWYN